MLANDFNLLDNDDVHTYIKSICKVHKIQKVIMHCSLNYSQVQTGAFSVSA